MNDSVLSEGATVELEMACTWCVGYQSTIISVTQVMGKKVTLKVMV